MVWVAILTAANRINVAHAQNDKYDEYAVKAVYLYNFSRYVEWPSAQSSETFVIGIVGNNPFGSYLTALKEKKVRDKMVAVRHFTTVDDYVPCHVLFVADKDAAAIKLLATALDRTKGRPVLVVAEADGAADRGAAINFIIVDSKVRFEINRDAATSARLTISAKLLRLATRASSAPTSR